MNASRLLIIFGIVLAMSCKEDLPVGDCDHSVKINSRLFKKAKTDRLTVDSLSIENDCLTVYYNYGGGCDDVDLELIEGGELIEGNIVLLAQFDDDDNCEALIFTSESFNLSPLKHYGSNTIIVDTKTDKENRSIFWDF